MDANSFLARTREAFGEPHPQRVGLLGVEAEFRPALVDLCSRPLVDPPPYAQLQVWMEYLGNDPAPNELVLALGGAHWFAALQACVVASNWSLEQFAFWDVAQFFLDYQAGWFTEVRCELLADCLSRLAHESRPGRAMPGLEILILANTSLSLMPRFAERLLEACREGAWLCVLLASVFCFDRWENPLLVDPDDAPLLWPRGGPNGRRWRPENVKSLDRRLSWNALRRAMKAASVPQAGIDWEMRLALAVESFPSRRQLFEQRRRALLQRLAEPTSERITEFWDDELR